MPISIITSSLLALSIKIQERFGNKTKGELAKRAGILGFVIYGTFDFTNLAVFSNYELFLGILDTFWGAILFSLTTYISLSIFN